MKFISIGSIGEFPEDFLFAKIDVEKKLLEDKVIDERMKLEDFIIKLDIQNTIYLKGQKSIAFRIIEGLNDNYVFYSFLDGENSSLFESFKEILQKLNYNLSNLERASNTEMLEEGFLDRDLFMLNFAIYKIV